MGCEWQRLLGLECGGVTLVVAAQRLLMYGT